MKRFNVTGTCIPEKHYMVDISGKIAQIRELIDNGDYFTINRARQYGKTTTFSSLYRSLKEEYLVIRMSFEGLGEDAFSNGRAFLKSFVEKAGDFMKKTDVTEDLIEVWNEMPPNDSEAVESFVYLGKKITRLCEQSNKEIILMIDEVDKTSNNQVFLDFLGLLRSKYLDSKEGLDTTFKSVILAGVYDVKNLKLKLRPDEEKKYNSPWNIAADFDVDMSFSPAEISTMLTEYEEDHHTGMDIEAISNSLYFYTGGYPFLVSRLCKTIDENPEYSWDDNGIQRAASDFIKSRNTLTDDLIKNYENNKELQALLDSMLIESESPSFNANNPSINLGIVFGIFVGKNGKTVISNMIIENILYDHVTSKMEIQNKIGPKDSTAYTKDGKLDMPMILTKFQDLMKSEYRKEDSKFLEQQGRLLFLCFLKPIINGTGFYYVEPETRNNSRMDLVVTYGKEEHIVELKIWRGPEYRKEGISQLEEYMDARATDKGYLVSFSFNKDKDYTNGYIGNEETEKSIFEVVV